MQSMRNNTQVKAQEQADRTLRGSLVEVWWKEEGVMGCTFRKAPIAPRNPSCRRNRAAISPCIDKKSNHRSNKKGNCRWKKKENDRTTNRQKQKPDSQQPQQLLMLQE